MTIEICYCYYKPFHTLPNRKWKKFYDKHKAKEFVDGLDSKKRFLWCVLLNGKEVDESWLSKME